MPFSLPTLPRALGVMTAPGAPLVVWEPLWLLLSPILRAQQWPVCLLMSRHKCRPSGTQSPPPLLSTGLALLSPGAVQQGALKTLSSLGVPVAF